MGYGDRDKGLDTALITLLFLILALFFISEAGSLGHSQTQEQVATSGVVSDVALGTFRVACSALVVITLSWVALDPKGSGDFPLYFKERERRPRKVIGPTRLAAFTMWHFALIGVSFGVSGAATWIHASGGTVPEWIIVSSPILFSTSFLRASSFSTSSSIILRRSLPVVRVDSEESASRDDSVYCVSASRKRFARCSGV